MKREENHMEEQKKDMEETRENQSVEKDKAGQTGVMSFISWRDSIFCIPDISYVKGC